MDATSSPRFQAFAWHPWWWGLALQRASTATGAFSVCWQLCWWRIDCFKDVSMETALSTSSPFTPSDASSSGRRYLGHHARGRLAALLPSGSIKEAKIVLEDDGNFASRLEPTFFVGWPRTLRLFGRCWVEVSQIVAFHWTASFSAICKCMLRHETNWWASSMKPALLTWVLHNWFVACRFGQWLIVPP